MKKIDTTQITNWSTAKKTRSLKAKAMVSIFADQTIIGKFLLDTLEGVATISNEAIACVGEAGDIWQQTSKKLLSKYDVVSVDKDGWMECIPKPDNSVDIVEVTDLDQFYIIGHYGTKTDEGFVQEGVKGDFIARVQNDHSDVYIIKRKVFLNTYSLIA